MLEILKENSLQGVGNEKFTNLYLEPPTESVIERARFSLLIIGLLGIVVLAITVCLTWLILPPVIGYGLMFAECSLMGVLYRRIFPKQEDTRWMLYVPILAIAFIGWQMYDKQTIESGLVYLFVALCMFGIGGIYYATWSSLKPYDDDDTVFRSVYKTSKDYPEIAHYIKKVAASGRDWLVPAELTAMESYIEQYESLSEINDMMEGVDYKTALFVSNHEVEEK